MKEKKKHYAKGSTCTFLKLCLREYTLNELSNFDCVELFYNSVSCSDSSSKWFLCIDMQILCSLGHPPLGVSFPFTY